MKIYTVHRRPGAADTDLKSVRLVPDGFTWWGILVPLLWLLVNRLWLAAIVFVLVSLALGAVISLSGLSDGWALAATLPVNLYVGLEGRQWLRAKLARLGYGEDGVAAGNSLEEAELAYFSRLGQRILPPAASATPAGPAKPVGAEGIGLFPAPGRPV
ncbi:MAG: DUF2628 domain-containing protein [Rhodobiaceae bacterium]|nr:DUF2628 domain-containing protein [Rhodobiaceae bacterium]